jgi:hypothetical protein
MREELNRILAKESLEDADINILAKNKGLLSQEEKVRLGFITVSAPIVKAPEVVAEPFVEGEPVAKKTRSKK